MRVDQELDQHLARPSAPRLEIIPPHPQHSFRVITHDFPSEICGWGAHPEYEIHLITKTHGTFIAGDHVSTFGPGHVSLIGPNLPHDWVSSLAPGEVAVDRDIVIHFTDDWIRSCLRLMPELNELDTTLALSRRGLVFSGTTAWHAAEAMLSITRSEGAERVAHLLRLLGLFARAAHQERLVMASEWLGQPTEAGARTAIEAGIRYILENLAGEVRLSTAAQFAFMSQPTFSKYFKNATGMTFSSMVKKLRVAQARLLLDSTDHSVAHVAQLSGYRNIANFNRQFLAEVGAAPTRYRRLESAQKPPHEVFSLGLRARTDPVASARE